MKLSEAIRLGAMMGPQIFHGGFGGGDNSSCAIGAAMHARECRYVSDFLPMYPWVESQEAKLVLAEGEYSGNVIGMCIFLNDERRWTREQIADWVATIEPSEEATKKSSQVAEVMVGAGEK